MYYKITDKESKIFKSLKKIRDEEKLMNDENHRFLREVVKPENIDNFFGVFGQQNFSRVDEISGFKFSEKPKDEKLWRQVKGNDGVFEPNIRFKKGRELRDKINSGFKRGLYKKVMNALSIRQVYGVKFTIPYVDFFNDICVIYTGNEKLTIKSVIEITSLEFDKIRNNEH